SLHTRRIAVPCVSYQLIQNTLDLVLLRADSMGLIPVNLGSAYRTIGESDTRQPFSFSPSSGTVYLAKAPPLPDSCAGGNRLNSGHTADDLKVHLLRNLRFQPI